MTPQHDLDRAGDTRSIAISVFRPLSVSILIIIVLYLMSNGRSDIAPYDQIGGGSYGILAQQENVTMESFYIDIVVDLPDVLETMTYHLDNPTDEDITKTVVVPICFDERTHYSYDIVDFDITVNGERVSSYEGSVSLEEDLIVDMSEINGIIATVELPARTTSNVTLQLHRTFDDHTESFVYFYSARTARYWNGTISRGTFRLEYLSEYKSIKYEGPNGTVDGRTVISVMLDWDGNSTYTVTVDTGIRYEPVFPMIAMAVGLGILAAVVVLIVFQLKGRKKQPRYTPPPPVDRRYSR